MYAYGCAHLIYQETTIRLGALGLDLYSGKCHQSTKILCDLYQINDRPRNTSTYKYPLQCEGQLALPPSAKKLVSLTLPILHENSHTPTYPGTNMCTSQTNCKVLRSRYL